MDDGENSSRNAKIIVQLKSILSYKYLVTSYKSVHLNISLDKYIINYQ